MHGDGYQCAGGIPEVFVYRYCEPWPAVGSINTNTSNHHHYMDPDPIISNSAAAEEEEKKLTKNLRIHM